MAARGLPLLYEFLKLLFILNCLVTTVVCQEMVIQHRKVIRVQSSATASPPAGVIRRDYDGSEDQLGLSLWSLLQTMDAFDTKHFDKGLEKVITSDDLTRTVHMSSKHADQNNFGDLSKQLPSTTDNGSDSSVYGEYSQGLLRNSPPIVQILAPNELSSSSTVQQLSATHNSTSSLNNHAMSNAESKHEKLEHSNESDEVTEQQLDFFPSIAVIKSHRQATTITPHDFTFYSQSYGDGTTPFIDESRREDTTPVAKEGVQQHSLHKRKQPRGHPKHHQHHRYKPNVERTTQPSRNIMYVVMMQDRRCDGVCCRRESYSGKCRLSMSCAVLHSFKTGMRRLTCGTFYHSVQVPVRSNPSWEPFTTTTPAYPGIGSTNVTKASTDVYETKEAGETSVASTPASATKSTQSLGGRDNPEIAAGNTATETSSDVDGDQTPVDTNKTRTFVSSDNSVVANGNSGVDDFVKPSSEEEEVTSWIIDFTSSNGTIDADLHIAVNDTENCGLTTESTAKNNNTESAPVSATSPAIMNLSESVDYDITTVDPVVGIALVGNTNETLEVLDTGEGFGGTFVTETVDDGFSEFFDGEYFGSEADDDVLTNETWINSHNETADDTEFGEFDDYVTDEQSDMDYNDDDYTRDVEYRDDYHSHTDYIDGGDNQGEDGNDSPRHLVYTDQVWFGGTDLALGPRDLSVQEEVQLSSPNNWHSFGGDGDAEWLNEENKRHPHLVLSSLADRRPHDEFNQ